MTSENSFAPNMSTPTCYSLAWHPCHAHLGMFPVTNVEGAMPLRHGGKSPWKDPYPFHKLPPLQKDQYLLSHSSMMCGYMSHYFLALISAASHPALLRLLS